MLTIQKYPLSSKAIIFGSVAFLIGLGGAGLYIERYRQHENLVFSRQESVLGTSDTRAAATASAKTGSTQAASGSSQDATSPQMASGGAELTSQQSVATSAPSSTSSSAPIVAAPTVEPGRGAGPTSEPATDQSADLIETLQGSCLLSDCLITTVQDATGSLLGN